MSTFAIDRLPLILCGPGALAELVPQLHRLGASAVLLVSDQGMAAAGAVGRVTEQLAAHFPAATFLAPGGEPQVATIDTAAAAVRGLGQGAAVVGLGGGTALDIAKLVAAAAAADRPAGDYIMCRHPFAGRLPSVMIPSTSGTGAEVTRTCVLADADGSKSWAWGDELCPDVALLEPAITATLPPTLTATTGLDAFIHAVEAATGQRTNAFTQAYALQAIRLITAALPQAVREPGDLTARQMLQEGACLAGLAINQSGTGIAHNIGHALGTVAHLPHAIAVTVAMRSTLAWNVAGAGARFEQVTGAMRPGTSPVALGTLFTELLAAVRFTDALTPFRQVRIDRAKLLGAMRAPENQPMRANNACPPDDDALDELAGCTVETWQRFTGQPLTL